MTTFILCLIPNTFGIIHLLQAKIFREYKQNNVQNMETKVVLKVSFINKSHKTHIYFNFTV